jgi:archaeosortase A (PGF-CTERM-specific)
MEKSMRIWEKNIFAVFFLIIPTLMLIVGFFIYPYPPSEIASNLIQIPILIALIFLGIGYIYKDDIKSKFLKITGWIFFAFFWSTQPLILYLSEGQDFINAVLCIIGVYAISYIAYHEWLSIKRNENINCLNWIAGAVCLAAVIYYGIEKTPLELYLREIVASHSGGFLDIFANGVEVNGLNIHYNKAYIYLIFSCTGVQSMVIFVGMIIPMKKVELKRKIYGLFITIIPIYILNFMRNAMVTFLVGNEITDFNTAHNIIAKFGALVVLIILIYLLIKIIPEIMDEINCLIDLPKRKGPLETSFKEHIKGK